MDKEDYLRFRTENAIDQLNRYGYGVFSRELVAVLEVVADINDDLWHSRHAEIVTDNIRKAKKRLDEVQQSYEARLSIVEPTKKGG